MKKIPLYYLLLFIILCSCKEQELIPSLPDSVTVEISNISLDTKTVELVGTQPTNGIIGLWTIQNENKIEGSFSDESNPLTTFTGGYFDDYVIRWTLTNGAESKFAEKIILISSGASLFELVDKGIPVGELKLDGVQDAELEESGVIGYMSDIDNNTYKWVKIGEKIWMAENLRTTKLRDGTPIAQIRNDECWYANGTYPPDYCESPANSINGFRWMNNDSTSFAATYGALYSRWVVLTGKLCPEGWHVPSIDDISYLKQYSDNYPGGFKEVGTEHWQAPNEGANNITGFSALPAGYVNGFNGEFEGLGYQTYFWTSSSAKPAYFGLRNIEAEMFFETDNFVDDDYYQGNSCRCVKD